MKQAVREQFWRTDESPEPNSSVESHNEVLRNLEGFYQLWRHMHNLETLI